MPFLEKTGDDQRGQISGLAEAYVCVTVHSAECERGVSALKRIHTNSRIASLAGDAHVHQSQRAAHASSCSTSAMRYLALAALRKPQGWR